ncbi:MAG: hypothetical protein IJ064_07285 [Bacteroidaceae bacterium]|nr:hypothetical protein [Bacteroidaceae bacterium]
MKRILTCLLLWQSLWAVAQNPTTLDGWAGRLKLFGEKIPQEEVFLHTDNTCYYLGDTLYYKAYMWQSGGQPSMLSQLLYVELLNQDGYLVERQKVEMKQGQGHGSFVLLDTLYGGYYELRAYTRWQLNWGQYEHPHTHNAEQWFLSQKMMHEYYRDYDKLYSRVFPVYDKPREPGDYAQDMTVRPLRRIYKQKEQKSHPVVTFYPEGGNLVSGVPNRVAFEVNDEEGKHLKGKLRIKKEELGIEAETQSRGRGTFVVTPSAEERLTATFTWEGGSEDFKLPKAVADGVALQASVEADGVHVHLRRAGTAVGEPLGLTASCHGVQKDFQTLQSDEAVVPLSKLPTGVIQLTVFNAQGRIYADRLVFVRQPDFQPQNITFSGLKEQYEPYEEVEMEMQVQCSATGSPGLSLAVRDAAHSNYTFDSGNIMTEMLLASQIRGFVEQPEYYFEADDPEHRQALDLLLLVQGWRRYDWVEMATPGAFALREPYERTELLMGEVSKYQSEQQADGRMEAMDQHESGYNDFVNEVGASVSALQGDDTSSITEAEAGTQKVDQMENGANERFTNDDTQQGTVRRANAEATDDRQKRRNRGMDHGSLRKEVVVHAEFVQLGVKEGESMVAGDMTSYNHGLFRIEAPRFYEACSLAYGAVDEDKWKGDKHVWMSLSEDDKGRLRYPDYYVKLSQPYPRFPKPYNFYQQTLPTARTRAGKRLHVDDDAILMDEVTVGARQGRLRSFDASKPAIVMDAYEAFNAVCDAGFCPGYYIGHSRFAMDVARTFIGDMNMERSYNVEQRFDSKNSSAYFTSAQIDAYNHLPHLDMVYVYTDYSPRLEGDKRFSQDNQPTVSVDLRPMPNEGERMTWLNRRMVLTGYAVCEDFYQPDYSKQRPTEPTDYRRTLYWNPNLQLDSEGKAKVSFFTGSRPAQLSVSAEGMTPDGQPLTGITYPAF